MSFIEGIGDEVTLFFIIVTVFFLAAVITLVGNSPNLPRTRQHFRMPALGNESMYLMLHLLREFGFRAAFQGRRLNNRDPSDFHDIADSLDYDPHTNNNDTLNILPDNQAAYSVGNSEADEGISTNNDASNVEEDSISTQNVTHEHAEQQDSESAQAALEEENVTSEDSEVPDESPQDEIRVRLKYLDDTEKTVTTSLNTNIGDFKKKHFPDDLRNNKIVRLIFAGHLLNNNSTIQNCRILDNSVVHVQVLPAPATQSSPSVNQEAELDLSLMLWPVLTVILSLCWLTYFKYPEFYNSLSLGILLLFSGFYFYFLSRVRQ